MPDMTIKKDVPPMQTSFHRNNERDYANAIYMAAIQFNSDGVDIAKALREGFNKIPVEDRPNFRRGCLAAIAMCKENEREIIGGLEKLAADIEAVKHPGKIKIVREARGLHNV